VPSAKTMLLGRKGSRRRKENESGCGFGCLTLIAIGMIGVFLKSCADAASTASPASIAAVSIVALGAVIGGLVLRGRSAQHAAEQEAETQRRFAEQQAAAQHWRFEQLAARFGADAARGIMERRVWQGATREMVQEAFGAPAAVDERVLKAKTNHTLKYNQIATNRYAFKVFLENGVVVGWEGESA